nr:Os06g0598850 [Ipomoea batatas]
MELSAAAMVMISGVVCCDGDGGATATQLSAAKQNQQRRALLQWLSGVDEAVFGDGSETARNFVRLAADLLRRQWTLRCGGGEHCYYDDDGYYYYYGNGDELCCNGEASAAKLNSATELRFHVPIGELQVFLQFIQHCPSTSMNAEVLECQLKIWYVWLNLHFEDFSTNQCGKEKQLLGHGKHERTQCSDIGLESITGNCHQFLRQRNSHLSILILQLDLLFESKMAAPPIRNKQFGSSIDFSFPKYQFNVMFSMLSTKA